MPYGCPSEIDPPLTLSFVRVDPEPVAAIDDLHGKRFVEFPQADVVDRQPVAFEQLRARRTRGRCPFRPARTRRRRSRGTRQSASSPSGSARLRSISKTAAAPSASCDALPAVTVPWPLVGSKCGLSDRNPSSVVSGRLHSSCSNRTSSVPATAPVFLSRMARVTRIGAISSRQYAGRLSLSPCAADCSRRIHPAPRGRSCTASPRPRPSRP